MGIPYMNILIMGVVGMVNVGVGGGAKKPPYGVRGVIIC